MPSDMPPLVTGVDTHAHVFTPDLPMVAGRRYSPDYQATAREYMTHLDNAGLSHGVLIQPSFLGTDNSYMLAALNEFPERLRGVAVVEKDISDQQLRTLNEAGVRGIRLNLIGKPLDDWHTSKWQRLWSSIKALGWSVEIQRGIDDVAEVAAQLLDTGVEVVIDHYGLPKGGAELHPDDYARLLALLGQRNAPWVKVSAPYRSTLSITQARYCIDALRDAYGDNDRLLWGSDWPHTQFEQQADYSSMWHFFDKVIGDTQQQRRILIDNPARLFGLSHVR